MQGTRVPSLGWEDPREMEMATHSSNLIWEMPWTEEPGGLQSVGSQKSQHVLATRRQPQRAGGGDGVVPLGEETPPMLGVLDFFGEERTKSP